MRFFRRLPPFLRVVSAIGLLFPIAGLMLLLYLYWSPFHVLRANFERSVVIALYLITLGIACSVVVIVFIVRMRPPGRRRRILLDSWQSQARAVALAVVGPLCGLIVTIANPPSFVFSVTFLVVWFVAVWWPLVVMWLLALG